MIEYFTDSFTTGQEMQKDYNNVFYQEIFLDNTDYISTDNVIFFASSGMLKPWNSMFAIHNSKERYQFNSPCFKYRTHKAHNK